MAVKFKGSPGKTVCSVPAGSPIVFLYTWTLRCYQSTKVSWPTDFTDSFQCQLKISIAWNHFIIQLLMYSCLAKSPKSLQRLPSILRLNGAQRVAVTWLHGHLYGDPPSCSCLICKYLIISYVSYISRQMIYVLVNHEPKGSRRMDCSLIHQSIWRESLCGAVPMALFHCHHISPTSSLTPFSAETHCTQHFAKS